jgi:hypothetical protein
MITRWVDKVSPPGTYTTHGLRVNAGIELALAGCTIDELKAVLGHRTAAVVQHYLKKMNRLHSALTATKKRDKWERRRVAEAKAKAEGRAAAQTGITKVPQIEQGCQTLERKRVKRAKPL